MSQREKELANLSTLLLCYFEQRIVRQNNDEESERERIEESFDHFEETVWQRQKTKQKESRERELGWAILLTGLIRTYAKRQ